MKSGHILHMTVSKEQHEESRKGKCKKRGKQREDEGQVDKHCMIE